jgi:hypothetical protein
VTPRLVALVVLSIAGSAAAQTKGPTIEHRVALLQGLDKVTARISPIRAELGQPTRFGPLEITARTCRETPPTEPPESAAFLEIRELPPASEEDAPTVELFSGWMFASSPAVSALEHPVYDVWVVDCEGPTEGPQAGQGVDDATSPASE